MLALALLLAAVPPAPTLTAALCPGAKGPCELVLAHEVGKDAEGRSLVVAGAVRSAPVSPDQPECFAEPWAVLHLRAGQVELVEPIVTLREESECSYGVSGGEESLEANGTRVTYTMTGGSAWGWSVSTTWRVGSRLEREGEERRAFWKLGLSRKDTSIDRRGVARVAWYAPRCAPGDAEPADGPDWRYTEIPLRPADDWRAPGATRGGLLVTAAGGDGYVVFGPPGGERDPRMRVVALSGRELLVDVRDDDVVTGSRSWVTDDHLELWTGSRGADLPHCFGPPEGDPLPRAQQWGIRLADGKVFPGAGAPRAAPRVERLALENDLGPVVRMRVTLPADAAAVTVVYSDSDGGRRQRRLTATSEVRLGDPLSLGVIQQERERR